MLSSGAIILFWNEAVERAGFGNYSQFFEMEVISSGG